MYYLTINYLVIETTTLSILSQIKKLNLLVCDRSIARLLASQGSFCSNLTTANAGYYVKKEVLNKFEHNIWQKYLAFTISKMLRTCMFIQKTCHKLKRTVSSYVKKSSEMKLNPKYGVAVKKVPHFIKLNFKFFPSHKGKNYAALNLRGKKSVW